MKVNQAQYVYVEDSEIAGAFWFPLDFVAVQYGNILNSSLHNAGEDCVVLKGGTAYFRIEGNEVYDCGAIGFSAGQGTGFEFMVSPWLHYEAYDLKFVNNVVHDVRNAGMAVRGGYNILLAYNTLFRIGIDADVGAPLLLVGLGSRSCDGDAVACQSRLDAGGWGPTTVGEGGEWIPNRNVYVYNNVFYNPSSARTMWSHFTVPGPITPPPNTNIPSPSASDANLRIRGNMIWNGPSDLPLGVGDIDQGCQASNPTCNPAQLVADNAVNLVEPYLLDPAHGNFRPYPGGTLFTVTTYAIPDFGWDDAPTTPGVPPGTFSNSVLNDRDGNMRAPAGPPGSLCGNHTTTNNKFDLDILYVIRPSIAVNHVNNANNEHGSDFIVDLFRVHSRDGATVRCPGISSRGDSARSNRRIVHALPQASTQEIIVPLPFRYRLRLLRPAHYSSL